LKKDSPFLKSDPEKAMYPDYSSVAVNFLMIYLEFEASSSFEITWKLNNKQLDFNKTAGAIDSDTSDKETDIGSKYIKGCTHYSVFGYRCSLYIDSYNQKDVGYYEASIRLLVDPKINLVLNTTTILPNSPEIRIYGGRHCSDAWSCKLNSTTIIQCNAQAHNIDYLKLFVIKCDDLDDCYFMKTNPDFYKDFIQLNIGFDDESEPNSKLIIIIS
jgi:hypothetical protein